MQAKSRARIISDRALASIFLAFLTLPLVGTFFSWDVYEVQENRRPTPFPDVAETSLAELPDAFDAYYRDHFGFRNFFIRRWNRLQRTLDKNLIRRVIHGHDKWLFYDRPTIILDFLGRTKTTDEDLEYWRSAIEGRQSWLADRGIKYLFAVAPNKPSIYPEKLPDDLREAARPTRLDLLVAYMEANSDVKILDMRPEMKAKKSWKTLYQSNDTHWNSYGAFVAYHLVMARLREWFPDLDPALELSECDINTVPTYGDLARHADLPHSEYTIPHDIVSPPSLDDFVSTEFIDPVFAPNGRSPEEFNPLPIHRSPNGRHRAIVFHDSFFWSSTKLLAHHFEETTCLWLTTTPEILASAVEKQKPDVVVEVIAERILAVLPSQSESWEEARRRHHGGRMPKKD